MPETPIESPRLAAFARACAVGGRAEVEREWSALARGGLPLTEPSPDDRRTVRVTFVWRPDRPVQAPSLSSSVTGMTVEETALRPAGSTGIWYRSLLLPIRTRAVYAFSPNPLPAPGSDGPTWGRYFGQLTSDPSNPTQLRMTRGPDAPLDDLQTFSVVQLPESPPLPWDPRQERSSWKEDEHRLESRVLGTPRSVWVYLPPGFAPARRRYNLVIVFDGAIYRTAIPAPQILERLVVSRIVGPSVLVLLGAAPGARTDELTRNPKFAQFLSRELLPWLRRRYHLRTDRSTTVLAGSSLGGLAAADAAMRYPRTFGRVLAQSGAFFWTGPGETTGGPTLMEAYARAPGSATKFYLDAGTFEGTIMPGMPMSLRSAVAYLRDVLVAKGYEVTYADFEGGHDFACWGVTFADGLVALLGKRSR